ncbi:MAG: hypothetical protein JNJ88_03955 [Planctomycetes bacterium]|nr:hypothetical protein [Planctomycetota bacterium]
MSVGLKTKLEECDRLLKEVTNWLKKDGGTSHQSGSKGDIVDLGVRIEDFSKVIPHLIAQLSIRESGRKLLGKISECSFEDEKKEIHMIDAECRIKVAEARHVVLSSYLSTACALADRIALFAANAYCKKSIDQLSKSLNLVGFVSNGNDCDLSHPIYTLLRGQYGYPIGFLYKLRNRFVHEHCQEFFRINVPFKIREDSLQLIESECSTDLKIRFTQCRNELPPDARRQCDLLRILDWCVGEVDDVSGMLAISTAHALRGLIGSAGGYLEFKSEPMKDLGEESRRGLIGSDPGS